MIGGGTVDRSDAMSRVIAEYARAVPSLALSPAPTTGPAEIELRLIDEKDFQSALQAAFGDKIARAFVARTDPQCMTSVKSTADGRIVHSVSFIIVDRATMYSSTAPIMTAARIRSFEPRSAQIPEPRNQKRMVGYLSIYDRSADTPL